MRGHWELAVKSRLWKYWLVLLLLPVTIWAEQGYFQQYVHYTMEVELLPAEMAVEGVETLQYVNHSPDTLRELFFHLYFNKFVAHSYRYPEMDYTTAFTEINGIYLSDSTELDFEEDNTLMWVPLEDTLIAPGDTLTLTIEFYSKLPPASGRFGYYGDHFDVGNWYPIPAVYDSRGWHVEQHIDGEFYHEWGDYDVRIRVPKGYVVAGTGVLQNPEVLPDSLEYPFRSNPYLEGDDTTTVVYHFVAPRVHDFAFSANPEFVVKEFQVDSVTLKYYLQPYSLDDWEEAMQAGVEALRFLIEKIGPYPYPELAVVDGFVTAGGIEYPNLVIINNTISNPRSISITVIHELAHQWFFGLLANNQTRFGWMDESFASFYEVWATQHIFGERNNVNHRSSYRWNRWFDYERNAYRDLLLNYFRYALSGRTDPVDLPMNFFQHNRYAPYYDKMAAVLFALRDMLGDSLFTAAIQTYYWTWRYKHPYPEDLVRVFNQVTGMELDWFWDEWTRTDWLCDYAVTSVRNQVKGQGYEATIRLKRQEPIAMPLQLKITLANGLVRRYRIPIAGMLPRGYADDDLPAWEIRHREYQTTLSVPSPVRVVEIENARQILDYNPFNDAYGKSAPVHWFWLKRQFESPYLDGTTMTLYPYLFYNDLDGPMVGIRTVGTQLAGLNRITSELLLSPRGNYVTGMLNYQTTLRTLSPDADLTVQLFRQAGTVGGTAYVLWDWYQDNRKKQWRWITGWEWIQVDNPAYALMPMDRGRTSVLFLEAQRFWRKRSYYSDSPWWLLRLTTRAAAPGTDFNFHSVHFKGTYFQPLSYVASLKLEMDVGGVFGNVPAQERYYLGQANAYQMLANPFYRAKGTLPYSLFMEGHIYQPGGGNIWAANQIPVEGATVGNRLLAFSAELSLWNPLYYWIYKLPVVRRLDFHLFTHWSQLWEKQPSVQNFIGEAGISIAYSDIPFVLRYFRLDEVRVDFPIWVNRPAAGHRPVEFRWGIQFKFFPFD